MYKKFGFDETLLPPERRKVMAQIRESFKRERCIALGTHKRGECDCFYEDEYDGFTMYYGD